MMTIPKTREIELNHFIKTLPEHQGQCIKMFYYQNMSYQEISQETGFELKKVKSYIQNGKRKLKIYLEDQ